MPTRSADAAGSPATVEILRARGAEDYAVARELFEEYARGLGIDLCFQGFADELRQLDAMYGPPRGCLLLARGADRWWGCGALRRRDDLTCEMKRLYVRPEGRVGGLGRTLATRLLGYGADLGYRRIVLDTLSGMTAARALYRSLGFVECAPYYENPLPGVVYLERDLVPGQPPASCT